MDLLVARVILEEKKMISEETKRKLRELRLHGMVEAMEYQ